MTNPPPPGPDPIPPPPPPVPGIFALALSLGGDVASVYSGRGGKGAVERSPRPVEPDSEGGRAGGSSPAPGAVSGFSLPKPPPLTFGEGPPYDALPTRPRTRSWWAAQSL